jgi:hypothetical protein
MSKLLPLLAVCAGLLLGGCSTLSAPFRHEPPRPGRTKLGSPLVILSSQTLGNYLIVEAKWDRSGPYHFLIDTGSSVTLVTPALAKRYGTKDLPGVETPHVHVKSAEGATAELPSATLERIELGDAYFDDVPVLIYDCAPLSAHLGLKIDGILGFPLFRETILTLDYPHNRAMLQRIGTPGLVPGTAIPFDESAKIPLISVRLGDRTFITLLDSGSDAPLSLNPFGLDAKYAAPPRPGATVGTLTGDRAQQVGRLAGTLMLGDFSLPNPVVDLTDELSAIGGEILKKFTVTFDQENAKVTFYRDSHDPIVSPPRRSAGLSFSKTPAYWRVVGVVPGSPAETAPVHTGDLVTRINGEPVAKWNLLRYEQLIATADAITVTFLYGTKESDPVRLGVFELVP